MSPTTGGDATILGNAEPDRAAATGEKSALGVGRPKLSSGNAGSSSKGDSKTSGCENHMTFTNTNVVPSGLNSAGKRRAGVLRAKGIRENGSAAHLRKERKE